MFEKLNRLIFMHSGPRYRMYQYRTEPNRNYTNGLCELGSYETAVPVQFVKPDPGCLLRGLFGGLRRGSGSGLLTNNSRGISS